MQAGVLTFLLLGAAWRHSAGRPSRSRQLENENWKMAPSRVGPPEAAAAISNLKFPIFNFQLATSLGSASNKRMEVSYLFASFPPTLHPSSAASGPKKNRDSCLRSPRRP